MAHYKAPDFLTKSVFNPLIMLSMKLGKGWRGSHILEVPGRKSGKTQTVPVNPLSLEGKRYLVAPRGDTHWARNLRAAGSGELRSRKGTEPFRAIEVPDAEKSPLIEAYLKRWGSQVRSQFKALPDPSEHPVFRLEVPA